MSSPLLVRRPMRRGAAVLLLASLFLAAPVALAQGAPVSQAGARLSYTRGPGTEGCPEEPSLREIVASQLGGVDPFVHDGAWRIEVVVQREGPMFQGTITLHDGDGRELGRQELASSTCGVLVDDIGISLSIAMRPLLPPRPAPGSAPASPPPGPPPRSAPGEAAPPASPGAPSKAPASKAPASKARRPVAPARPVQRPVPPPARPRLQIGTGVLLAAGTTPSVTVGISGAAGVRWEAFSLSLEARGDLPIDAEPYGGLVLGVSGVSGSLVPCGHAAWFFGCAIATAGGVWHVGAGTRGDVAMPYAGLGFRAGLEVPLWAGLAGQLTGDLLINTLRSFHRSPHGAGWKAAPISQAAALRLVAFF